MRGRLSRWLSTGRSLRSRRLLLLLTAIWLLSVFDLTFTLAAYAMNVLIELNPIADWLLERYGSAAVVCYKVGLMGMGTIILWTYRGQHCSESAAWLTLMVYVVLSVRWYAYYHGEDTSEAAVEAVPVIVDFEAIVRAKRAALLEDRRTRTPGEIAPVAVVATR